MFAIGKYAVWKCVAVGALIAAPVSGHDLPDAGASGAAMVHVTVSHLRSDKGSIIACLTADPVRFPKCSDDRDAKRALVPAAHADAIVFRGVRPGRYAVALLHDENNNGKADRTLAMIPREGFGFSRDAKVRMGPPRFGDAAFAVKDGATRMTIAMRYML